MIFKKPILQSKINDRRSSYFGYSINLRKNHIIIGAPRAQTTIDTHRKFNETGVIFKCQLDTSRTTQACSPYYFDKDPKTNVDRVHEYEFEKKEFQMLGFAMDGFEDENDQFVVCAPMLKSEDYEPGKSEHYFLHGMCYWVSSTKSRQPLSTEFIKPLRQRDLQTLPESKITYYYMLGESGFSVHVTEMKDIIIGCPGIYNWTGSVIRYRSDVQSNLRRSKNFDDEKIRSEVPNPFYLNITEDSYFGYAVSSAKFFGPENEKVLYVASAPRAENLKGVVYIFDIKDDSGSKKIKIHKKIQGDQFGEYFGYAIICEDFNADGFPDLAISAPFNNKNGLFEKGAVYIFINKGNVSFFPTQKKMTTNFYVVVKKKNIF